MIQVRTCRRPLPTTRPSRLPPHLPLPHSNPTTLAQVDVRPAALPLRAGGRDAIRVLLHAALDVVHRKLALKLALERRDHADEVCARLLEDRGGRDAAVRLDLQEEVWLERVRDLVAGEEDARVPKELSGKWGKAKGMWEDARGI